MNPICPKCGAPVEIERRKWAGTAAMHLDPPEAYESRVHFSLRDALRERVAALTPREMIDVFGLDHAEFERRNLLNALAGEGT